MFKKELNIMSLKYLIVNAICAINTGKFVVGLKYTMKLSLLLSIPIFSLELIISKITNWGIDNQDYISIVLGAIAIDHALGTLKHLFVDRDFSIKTNITGIIKKIGLVVAMGFLFEGLSVILKEQDLIKSYLHIVTSLIVFLYPAISAWENSSILSGGKFPPKAWLDRFKKFNQTLKPNDLMNKEDE